MDWIILEILSWSYTRNLEGLNPHSICIHDYDFFFNKKKCDKKPLNITNNTYWLLINLLT